ncbi:MAG: hypothetical protein R3E90_04120 [Marinicella sp.]
MKNISWAPVLMFCWLNASANVITVNELGMVIADDGKCTLTEAITSANENLVSGQMIGECAAGDSGSDDIFFDLPQGQNTLFTDDELFPVVMEDLRIFGPGADLLTIDAQQFSQIFGLRAAFELSGVTLLNGEAAAGASIYQFTAHDLSLTDCMISGSSVSGSAGAIRVLGGETQNQVIIEGCDFIDNDAVDNGGVIHASAVSGRSLYLNLKDVNFIDNQSVSGSGGALTVVTNGTGEIDFDFDRVNFSGNQANINGGAIHMEGEGITGMIEGSSFNSNTASISGGAVHWLDTGDIYSINNTFYQNVAQKFAGAIYARADQGALATINLINNSIIQNTVATGVSSVGGGGVYSQNASTWIKNTLIAENQVVNGGVDCGGQLSSLGFNFVGNGSDCSLLTTSGDMVGSSGNVLLPNLSYVISPVFGVYAIPNILSPLINSGDPDGCDFGLPFTIDVDQLDLSRHQDPLDDNQVFGRCDIGSVEVQSPDLIFYSGFENSAS